MHDGWVRSELPSGNANGRGMDWQQVIIDFVESGDKCWAHKGKSRNNANYVASTLRMYLSHLRMKKKMPMPSITVTCRKDVVYIINNDALEG